MLRFGVTGETPLEASNQHSELPFSAGPSYPTGLSAPTWPITNITPTQSQHGFHLRPRRKARPHLAMKEYRRGS